MNFKMPAKKRTKPRSPAHAHVRVHEEVHDDDGTTYSVYSCAFCEEYTQKLKRNGQEKPRVKISRFVEHFSLHCKKCPEQVRSDCLKTSKSQIAQFIKSDRKVQDELAVTTNTDRGSQGREAPITLENFYPVLGKKDGDRINKSIAKFMAVCGVPFAVANKEAFKEMVKELNPAFVQGNHLKSPDTYRRKFLPRVYDDVKEKVKKNANAFGREDTRRTVGCDGFTTGGGLHVTNFGETIGTNTWYTDTVEAGTAKTNLVALFGTLPG